MPVVELPVVSLYEAGESIPQGTMKFRATFGCLDDKNQITSIISTTPWVVWVESTDGLSCELTVKVSYFDCPPGREVNRFDTVRDMVIPKVQRRAKKLRAAKRRTRLTVVSGKELAGYNNRPPIR